MPEDVSDAGRSAARDAELFPSDELLSQRVLWTCLLIVTGWSVLGLAGFLPLYMVDTPCLAKTTPPAEFTGTYSALQDLSLLRLMRLLDPGAVNTGSNSSSPLRILIDGVDRSPNGRTRMIVLTVLAILLGVLPAFVLVMREFNKLVAYRERWVAVRCGGLEMGWLSARRAPGFVGWGERRIKDYMVKIGLSASLDAIEPAGGNSRRRRERELIEERRQELDIDIRSLFSIG